jgi:hypothetical protein
VITSKQAFTSTTDASGGGASPAMNASAGRTFVGATRQSRRIASTSSGDA